MPFVPTRPSTCPGLGDGNLQTVMTVVAESFFHSYLSPDDVCAHQPNHLPGTGRWQLLKTLVVSYL
jgi:hypothetical protein